MSVAWIRPPGMEAPGRDYKGGEMEAVLDQIDTLTGLANVGRTQLDACRVTTAGAFQTTAVDPSEIVKIRSAPINLTISDLYSFHGQILYQANDPWVIEIRKGSTGGTMMGIVRLDITTGGACVAWDIEWAATATEEQTQFFYVANRLSGAGSINFYGTQDGGVNTFAYIDRVGVSSLMRDVA